MEIKDSDTTSQELIQLQLVSEVTLMKRRSRGGAIWKTPKRLCRIYAPCQGLCLYRHGTGSGSIGNFYAPVIIPAVHIFTPFVHGVVRPTKNLVSFIMNPSNTRRTLESLARSFDVIIPPNVMAGKETLSPLVGSLLDR